MGREARVWPALDVTLRYDAKLNWDRTVGDRHNVTPDNFSMAQNSYRFDRTLLDQVNFSPNNGYSGWICQIFDHGFTVAVGAGSIASPPARLQGENSDRRGLQSG